MCFLMEMASNAVLINTNWVLHKLLRPALPVQSMKREKGSFRRVFRLPKAEFLLKIAFKMSLSFSLYWPWTDLRKLTFFG